MVNYAGGFNQSETGKYFQSIINTIMAGYKVVIAKRQKPEEALIVLPAYKEEMKYW